MSAVEIKETYPSIMIWGWEFKMEKTGEILSRNVEKGLDWDYRRGSTTDIDDACLWGVRSMLGQLNQIFPRVQPHLSKTDTPPENVAPTNYSKAG